jgi:hypothetical protein
MDEHPMAAEGSPIFIDLGTWEVYHHEDMIGMVSALQVVSLAVEKMGENDFLRESRKSIGPCGPHGQYEKGDL